MPEAVAEVIADSVIEVEKIKKNKNFINMKLERSKDGEGISLYLQSDLMEPWLKSQAKGTPIVPDSGLKGWHGHKFYNIDTNPDGCYMAGYVGGAFMPNGSEPNMSVLCVVGLTEGVTINLPGMFSETMLKSFGEKFKAKIINIYKQYFKKVNISLTICESELIG